MMNTQDDLAIGSLLIAKEIYFYSTIIPAMESLEETEKVPNIDRIDGFPRYFGSRFSLNSSRTLNILE